jgi:hypothetical protein
MGSRGQILPFILTDHLLFIVSIIFHYVKYLSHLQFLDLFEPAEDIIIIYRYFH